MRHHKESQPTDTIDPKLSQVISDIAQIVRIRQTAQREVNAFPAQTRLTYEQRSRIIESLTPITHENALEQRLGALALHGMRSLDLMRHENLRREIYPEVRDEFAQRAQEVFDRLQERDGDLAAKLGMYSTTGYMRTSDSRAPHRFVVVDIGSKEAHRIGAVHGMVTREVAELETTDGQPISVSKRTDFVLLPRRLGVDLAETVGVLSQPNDFGFKNAIPEEASAERLSKLFVQAQNSLHTQMEDLLHGVHEHPDAFYPVATNYYAVREISD